VDASPATFENLPQPQPCHLLTRSAEVDAPLWSLDTFRRLFTFLAAAPRPVELFTYSASTAVRSAMLAAGFHVARGVPGPKETTIALTTWAGNHALLRRDCSSAGVTAV
jgi:tRNA U34 5-methylaminomethyl-2-thiouridine-forming methyltransferase MnmC